MVFASFHFGLIAQQTIPTEMLMPEIQSLAVVDTIVEQHGKFECTLELNASYDNPYDYDQIVVSGLFTAPDGSQKRVDGFFMQDYELNTADGSISPLVEGAFKLRFSPDQVGKWSYQISVTDKNGISDFEEQNFECISVFSPKNKGFVRTGQRNYLELDNGKQLILIGENMAWENNNAYIDYKEWLTHLSDMGGNFIRLWHAHWGLGIEWRTGWRNFEGLRKYHQGNSFYQDWLFDFCAEKGIFVMLALQHHGPVSSQVNPNWNDSPYNMANGGPCQNTWDFFTNAEALAHTKNRFRYILARWGYSRAIQSWELFNEVNWTDNFQEHQTEIQDWHADMAAYLKTLDPYNHSVSTSFAALHLDPVVWSNPDIDFTQTHYYHDISNIEKPLASGIRTYLEEYDKPTLAGEFGLGPYPELSNEDGEGIHFHNGMWGALFAGGMGTAMSWWWDSYVHPRNLYYHFAPIAAMATEIPFLEENMSPAFSFVQGAPGNLVLNTNLGWGIRGDENISIHKNGTATPANPGLGQFLYGSQWNTQYRSPPSFMVKYPREGSFTVRTSSELGESPKISIYLDGVLVLNETGIPNKDYTINVPAGMHTIKVDNLGIDWITIGSYTFSDLGSQVDSYVLTSDDNTVGAGWVLNHAYNHLNINENGQPLSVIGSELVVEGFEDGNYFVKWYNCLTGEMSWTEAVSAVNNELRLPVPELYWDLAFIVDGEETMVKDQQVFQKTLDFGIYPNPIKSGGELTLNTSSQANAETRISLLDASGRSISSSTIYDKTVQLPNNLPSSIYWLVVEYNGKVGTKPIYVE